MGCGSSSPAKASQRHSVEQKVPPPPPAIAPPLAADGGSVHKKEASTRDSSELQSKNAEDVLSSTQTSSGMGHAATPSLLSSRQSLIAASGSLGSRIGRASLLPPGWAPGRGVLVREDGRIAHINNLACSVVKTPVVLVVTADRGRVAVATSKGLYDLGSRQWLPAFWGWMSAQDLGLPLVISDTAADPRTKEREWVKGPPGIRFLVACSIPGNDGEPAGTILGLDTQPHMGAEAAGMMLGTMANMVSRELEGVAAQPEGGEYLVAGHALSPDLRCKLDAYGWTTLLLDTAVPGWRILYANHAFRSMTGVPPGCLEGNRFWDYFSLPQPVGTEPWEALSGSLEQGTPFPLPPVLFTPQNSATTLKSAQLLRVELRQFNSDTALTFEVEPPKEGTSSLWFASFQPEARQSLDLQLQVSRPTDAPFPGLELGPVIGKGSFGCVCRGALGYLIVAVKIIEVEAIFKVDKQGMPLEATLAKGLRHPHVVQMIDFATRIRRDVPRSRTSSRRGSTNSGGGTPRSQHSGDGANPRSRTSSLMGSALSALGGAEEGGGNEAWLILEYCDSGSLLDGIENEWFGTKATAVAPRRPNLEAIEATAYEIASAMRYLHKHNILHGDLTASNVLLSSAAVTARDKRGFVAKVADFGLSREALTSKVETVSHGTVTHMPPELLNEQILSKKADVYAFGVLLVEMYTGERAFTGMRHAHIIHTIAVLRKHPTLPPDAPPHLVELAEDCMQENFKQRPSFDDVVARLRARLRAR